MQKIIIPESGKKRLQQIFGSLDPSGKNMLLEFAEFLSEKYRDNQLENESNVPEEPLSINRPDKESVIKAIKRLSKNYPMIDKSKMLTATSTLMTEHVMQGRDAEQIIDELEELFKTEYDKI